MRQLEIGPGKVRLPGFETLDILPGPLVDHVGDATKLPFPDNTFGLVYSSHVIEHLHWWQTEDVIAEWARVVKPGGTLEIHYPDSTPLMRQLIQFEDMGYMTRPASAWKNALHRDDPYLSASGRILNYMKNGSIHQLHRAILVPRYIAQCFQRAGLVDLRDAGEPRGPTKHRSVNASLAGTKPSI